MSGGSALSDTAKSGPRYDFPEHSAFHRMAQRVPVRQGSLVVWDVRLVHGSQPDQSPSGRPARPRFVQFVSLRTQRLLETSRAAADRTALIARLFAAHGLEEPRDEVERRIAGLPARQRSGSLKVKLS